MHCSAVHCYARLGYDGLQVLTGICAVHAEACGHGITYRFVEGGLASKALRSPSWVGKLLLSSSSHFLKDQPPSTSRCPIKTPVLRLQLQAVQGASCGSEAFANPRIQPELAKRLDPPSPSSRLWLAQTWPSNASTLAKLCVRLSKLRTGIPYTSRGPWHSDLLTGSQRSESEV